MTAKTSFAERPAIAHMKAMLKNLQARTGKNIDEWVKLTKKSGGPTRKEQLAWLRKNQGLGMATAMLIAEHVGGSVEYNAEENEASLFSGGKAGLKPIYEALMEFTRTLGDDVTATPTKTTVPLRRKHVFAQIKPATNTRIDLGLALGKIAAIPKRLVDTGGLAKGDRITHRVALTSVKEIDAEVKKWLGKAYELDE